MLNLVLLCALSQLNWNYEEEWIPNKTEIIHDKVDTISVCDCGSNKRFIFFWDIEDNELSLVTFSSVPANYRFFYQENKVILFFEDDDCFRMIEANVYFETQEKYDVSEEWRGKPWFARVTRKGLTSCKSK
jgi:hypothetical protein